MRKLPKIIALVLAFVFVLTPLTSCTNNNGNESGSTEPSTPVFSDPSTENPTEPTTNTQGGETVSPNENASKFIKILFIGNSLTFYNDMPNILMQLGRATGKAIYTERATVGSSTMCQQISTTTEVGRLVEEALKREWDYIVVQPSRRITDQENTVYQAELAAADVLNQMIKDNGAKTIIYGTMGNNGGYAQEFKMSDDGINSVKVANFDISRKDHNEYMRTVNAVFSERMGAPVVDAAQLFEYIISGYPGIGMYHSDNRHPSLAGSYAVACAFYSYFYDESAEDAAALTTLGLQTDMAMFLAQAADHIVRGAPEPTIKVDLAGGMESTIKVEPVKWAGNGTESDPYIVANAGNFMYMANLSYEGESFEGKYIKQTADVDLLGGNFIPIGVSAPFKGNYDGGGHQIATFAVTAEKAGIFSQTDGATISGIKASSITFVGTFVGGIVGEATNNTVIRDCVVYQSSSMEGSERVGGIVGNLLNSKVTNCVNLALTIARAVDHCYVGGIVGLAANGSSIEYCYNKGDVNVDNRTAQRNACGGGILGCNGLDGGGSANVTRCVNEGIILFEYDGGNSTRAYTGGIIGRAGVSESSASVITECYNYGEIVNESTFLKYFGIGQMCGIFVNPNVSFVKCFGLDTISEGLLAKHGEEYWNGYTNYVSGKEGKKFTDAQKFRLSDDLGVKTQAELDALTADIRAALPQW